MSFKVCFTQYKLLSKVHLVFLKKQKYIMHTSRIETSIDIEHLKPMAIQTEIGLARLRH